MPIATAPPVLDTSDPEENQRDPWDAAFSLQLNERNGLLAPGGLAPDNARAKSPVPSINVISPTDTMSAPTPRKLFVPDEPRDEAGWKIVLRSVAHTLFPSLVDLGSRPWLWKIIAVCSAPAIFLLTLTLPVVVDEPETEAGILAADEARRAGTPSLEAQLIEYDESDAEEDLLRARIEAEEHVHDVRFNKWLTATQCALSPVFCISVLFSKSPRVTLTAFFTVLGR